VLLRDQAKLKSLDPERTCRPPGVARQGDILAQVPQAVNGILFNPIGPFALSPQAGRLIQRLVGIHGGSATRFCEKNGGKGGISPGK
jgi:hypothetical protein